VIRLCYSNRTEALCEALAENLGAGRSSLFDPIHLVVPNPLVESYVKQSLARRLGIAAHIETRFLRGFLRDIAVASAPEILIVDRDLVEGELLALFADPGRLASRELEAVRGYLMAPAGEAAADDPDHDEGLDRRRVQLAAQVAALFDEYAFSRPEMLAAWRVGGLVPGLDEPLQRWQRELWLALHGRGGAFSAGKGMTLPDFFREVPPEDLRPPAAAHLFGISYVARLYRSIFASIARASALHVYTLNPCREYWEDLEPRRRNPRSTDARRFPPRRGATQLTLDGFAPSEPPPETALENPLLALWGRPGRDNMRLLNQLSECDFEARFVDPVAGASRPSLLAALQREVLDREPAGDRADGDGSLVVMPAPDPRRELETVAAEIWSLLRADETLTFADVALIVPPAAAPTYLPLARAVFDEAGSLPHTILDVPRAAERRILDAVTLLLELPTSPLARPDLLRVAMHPAVARRFPDVDPADWVGLCEELQIVRGADRADHEGNYLERDQLSWDQGLRRLALGAFLSGRRSGEERPFLLPTGAQLPGGPPLLDGQPPLGGGPLLDGQPPLGGEPLLAAELAPAAEPAARTLGILARELIAYAQAAAEKPATFAVIAALLRRTIAATIHPADPDEEAALGDAFAAIEAVNALVPPDLEISFRVAAELLEARLGAGPSRHLSPEGVTVASFVPMRALPFRILFIVGLDEGVFPAPEGLDALDLRAHDRRPGDVTPREKDEYMFLEALLSARERMHLSYVGRDAVTGEDKNPSSTLLALLEVVPASVRRPMPPQARHLDDAACAVIPAAARERQAATLGSSARAAAGGAVKLPAVAELRTMLPAEVWADVAARLDWVEPPALEALTARRSLTLADLQRFIECPLQASARVLLPLGSDDDAADDAEAALREHERLDESRLHTVPLLRGVMLGVLEAAATGAGAADADLAEAYDRAATAGLLDGTLPGGLFGRAMRARHLSLLHCWRDGLYATTDGPVASPAALWLGAAPEHRRDVTLLPALDLSLPGGVSLALEGRTELLAETAAGDRVTISFIASTSNDYPERDLLRPFFTHLALAVADGRARATRAILIRPKKDGSTRVESRVFPPITPADARRYLGALAAELLGEVHAYFLPCEAIFTWRKRRDKGEALGVRDAVLLLRDDNWTRFVSDRGPVPDPRGYPVPAEAIAAGIVARRFGPYFAAMQGAVEPPSNERRP
jgi:exodeoxyribonuclease V gamma subunit